MVRLCCIEALQYSMKLSSRPLTGGKDCRRGRCEDRTTVSQLHRPLTAKNDSLKRIIQVIQKTLSRGVQNALARSATARSATAELPRHRPHPSHLAHSNNARQRSRRERDFPQYRTELAIGNGAEPQRSAQSIKSAKKIYPSFELEDFVPYMKQEGNYRPDPESPLRKERPPMKKVTRKRKTLKESEKQSEKQNGNPGGGGASEIDKWESDPSLLHFSFLLDQQIR